MPYVRNAAEVDAWFREHGWFPGRDVSDQVPELVREVVEQYAQAGFPAEPSPAALRFLGEHAGLRLAINAQREDYLYLSPYLLYAAAPRDVAELGGHLGVGLFPIGVDTSDGSLVLMDERGRFFYIHDTGAYYMGADKYEAVISLFHAPMEDAEDYFV
ncbi:SUKH-3 domain-containing protein [Streptomyces antimicrobicus]|uniref:SUKH-3 domain-containing protein n=1 Tax=Streptomyces antimicrobicus TaxID=2883108 RepID=A0ABS8B4Y6_9ACTN|nr:SUKH-3 domain-containing protein [Streptomyces antimicrobicus]MCB5179669.1 SUKH-3 domain-containing protein [Streptomyces antimicrobicus]